MIVAIDARPLISDKPSGIGVYLVEVLESFKNRSDNNTYILYSNKAINNKYSFPSNFVVKIIPGKIGTLWLRYVVPKHLLLDGVDVFWGTQHILPRNVGRVRYVVTIHDLALLIHPQWGSFVNSVMQNIYCKRSIFSADIIFADSESTRRDIIRLGVDGNKVKTVYLGKPYCIDNLSDENEKRILSELKIESPFYLFVGTIEPRKNIETIVSAFEMMKSENEEVSLVLAGGLGWKYKTLVKQINRSKYKNSIIMPGYISDEEKAVLYRHCISLVFPSHYEGFGIPILEAYNYKAIVITSSNSSLKEVGGEPAFYIKNETDVNDLYELMKKAKRLNSAEKDIIIKKEQSHLNSFSWNTCGDLVISEIESLHNK